VDRLEVTPPVSGHIPRDVIERVLAVHDIVELVGRQVCSGAS
jgi:hypothetical protein